MQSLAQLRPGADRLYPGSAVRPPLPHRLSGPGKEVR